MKAILFISLSFFAISLFSGCRKEEFAGIPVLSTSAVTEISGVSMSSGGNITSDGGASVTSRGISWSQNPDETSDVSITSDGTGTGSFTSNMSGLIGSTTYFVRAYATNSAGTAYGEQISFTTRVTDVDGNSYNSISIGTQTWMVENLRVTHLNDGSEISIITSDLEWTTASTPSYCWYFNIVPADVQNSPLYNFNTVQTGKLCPAGWSVPSDGDWKTLEMFMGMSQAEVDMINWRGEGSSSILKAADGWYVLNGIQDMYGFKALPAGVRDGLSGGFIDFNNATSWWSSTVYDEKNAWVRSIGRSQTTIYRGNLDTRNGFSVRCFKNN